MTHYTYLLVNLCSVSVPFLFSFHPKINFYRKWKAYFPANLLIASLFILWDINFTSRGVWGFNEAYITGIYFFNLPIEEVLFFFCIPYACVFTYHCWNIFFPFKENMFGYAIIASTLLLFFLFIGFFFYDRAYTSSAFIAAGCLQLSAFLIKYNNAYGKFLRVYPILLIPFFIVNGILTGTGLEQPVVWYNDAENLAIRLFTIPIEDVFYGYAMLFSIILIYERLCNKLYR